MTQIEPYIPSTIVVNLHPLEEPNITANRQAMLEAAVDERRNQDRKWGRQRHDVHRWVGILAEEFGEVAMAANELYWPGDRTDDEEISRRYEHLLTELKQVMAVCAAIGEDMLDRPTAFLQRGGAIEEE